MDDLALPTFRDVGNDRRSTDPLIHDDEEIANGGTQAARARIRGQGRARSPERRATYGRSDQLRIATNGRFEVAAAQRLGDWRMAGWAVRA
jgi:hypothetical protein